MHPNFETFIPTGSFSMTFGADTDVPLRMNYNESGDLSHQPQLLFFFYY